MTAKSKTHPLNQLGGMHTAGIFSDMSIDGPEIGTLVVIVDRGKNLPNRKTIGKQDPYCAARLGKEARKTATDIRGGQTPRWDQELRFTVHDSPDYFQLKVSVFNDDKKTDLIGETWIDLKDIVVPGGGQSDKWHQLSYKSKYAGELRMEITYYDTRPKPEKPVSKPKPVPAPAAARDEPPRVSTKRRPLPASPATGDVPAPLARPEHAQTPPRSQPVAFVPKQSPLQTLEYSTPPATRPRGPQSMEQYSSHPPSGSTYNTPPQPPQPAQSVQPVQPPRTVTEPLQPHRSVERFDQYGGSYAEDPRQSPAYHEQPQQPQQPQQQQVQQYDRPDPRVDPRHDPRQDVRQDVRLDPRMPSYGAPNPLETAVMDDPRYAPVEEDRPPPPPVHRTRNNSGSQELVYRSAYDASSVKGTPPSMRQDVLRSEAHRSSFHISNAYPGRPLYKPNDSGPVPPAVPQHGRDNSRADDYQPSPPRHLTYDADPHDSHYRSMQPTVEDMPDSPPSNQAPPYRTPETQMQRYDDPNFRDVPSPAPLNISGRNSAASGMSGNRSPAASPNPHEYDMHYAQQAAPPADYRRSSTGPSPRPSISGHGGQRGRDHSPGPAPSPHHSFNSQGAQYGRDHSPGPVPSPHHSFSSQGGQYGRDHSPGPAPSPHHSFSSQGGQYGRDRSPGPARSPRHSFSSQGGQYDNELSEVEDYSMAIVPHKSSSRMSDVPSSLIPGVDPSLADIASRVYEDRPSNRRYTLQDMTTPTRGRQHSSDFRSSYGASQSGYPQDSYHQDSYRQDSYRPPDDYQRNSYRQDTHTQDVYTPPAQYDNSRALTYSGTRSAGTAGRVRGHSTSPQPPLARHTIKRKSVSPAPPPPDARRNSGIPFGPDSYDALNPNLAQAKQTAPADYSDPDTKIITHDGKEIDPSDHLPVSSWAPEPEQKKQTTPEPPSRPSPAGAQPMPSSGRRQIRVQARPHSMSVSSHNYADQDPSQPPSSGRNRLQKKPTYRISAQPSSSGPLVPIDNTPSGSGFTPPRQISRASTLDYNGVENREPMYGSSPGNRGSYRDDYRSRDSYHGRGDSYGSYRSSAGPPIPAKVPLQLTMSGANGTGRDDDWALMQEMQSIDLGTGRSRRHGGY